MKTKNLLKKIRSISDRKESLTWLNQLSQKDIDKIGRLGLSLDPNDRTLLILIKNNSKETKKLTLFAAFDGLFNIMNDTYLSINVLESSYGMLKAELLSKIFITHSIRIDVENPEQFKNPMEFSNSTCSGMVETHTIWPNSKMYHPFESDKIFILNENIIIDGNFSLKMDINPLERMLVKLVLLAKISIRGTQVCTKEPFSEDQEPYNFSIHNEPRP